jgi:hypothetical protein
VKLGLHGVVGDDYESCGEENELSEKQEKEDEVH